jgi:hypothetical protein
MEGAAYTARSADARDPSPAPDRPAIARAKDAARPLFDRDLKAPQTPARAASAA